MTKFGEGRYRHQDPNTGYWHCELCAAVIVNRGQHDDWHDKVDAISERADYAAKLAEF